jgi:hypothetical protein
MNAVEIEAAVSELAVAPFDREEFPYSFLAAFGNKATTIQRLRKGDSNASDLPSGVLQRNHIHIAVAEPGKVGLNRPGFPRHLQSIILDNEGGVNEQQAIHGRVQG